MSQQKDSAPTMAENKHVGALPAHWSLKQLRRIATVEPSNVDKKTVEGEESVRLCNYVDVYKNEKITKDLDFMAATAKPDQIQKFGLLQGDVLVTKDSETPDDIAVPAIISETIPDLVCGYHLALIRPRSADVTGEFLFRALQSMPVQTQLHARATGVTRFGLTKMDLGTVEIPVPPLAEQTAITKYIDQETAKIDNLIKMQESQIALLRERRQALIAEAVTGQVSLQLE